MAHHDTWSPTGGYIQESEVKKRRKRTIFTSDQLKRLESEFRRQQYLVGSEREQVAAELTLSEAQVKIWFQNRRIKWRRENNLNSEEGQEYR